MASEKRYVVDQDLHDIFALMDTKTGKQIGCPEDNPVNLMICANLLNQHADTIEALKAALKPFAEAGANYNDGDDDQEILDESIVNTYGLKDTLTLYDLWNARQALAEAEGKGEGE